ncbi:hypothetical protein JKF63_04363 [Porcisia hertigi]|uniref:Uncharacterized protein n=1 Tax=Porcisia hertigi TaxID=2761500 RepID=A0A836IGE9_9TRYP|nr:hypothetical protein JKF63_04363 [Porcisia hertigi]
MPNVSTSHSVLAEESASYAGVGPHAKLYRDPLLMQPLCSSPPHEHPGERGHRASSVAALLTLVPMPQDETTALSSECLSPTTVNRVPVPRPVMYKPSGAHEIRGVTSPVATPNGSPTGVNSAVATRWVAQRHGLLYDPPLSFATVPGGGSCGDSPRCHPERCEGSTTTANARTTEQIRERPSDASRPAPFPLPPESTANVSTPTTSGAGVAVATTRHLDVSNYFSGGTAPYSTTGSANGDREAQPGTGEGLRRAVSCDTLVSVGSSRSKPVLTPAVHGPTGVSGAASGTASNTTTSVTYTRRNVCLGALDLHGNLVTSLPSLLVQMSQPAGDHEEGDQPETRLGAASPHSFTQQLHQRNTLSMQNLMAHTQQVGEMAPEDKVKRFHAKPDGGLLGMHHRIKGTVIQRPRCAYTKPCKLRVASSAAYAPPTSITSAAATAAASRSQVGSLKDVLQECNFLSLNDVVSAIADTHVHELREARQRLSSAHGDSKYSDSLSTSMVTNPSSANVLPSNGAPLLSTGDESAATAGCPLGCALSAASWRPAALRLEPPAAGTSSARGIDSGECRSASVSTDNTCPPALYLSMRSLDTQQVLTLAAAITEASLNLDRNTEVSFAGSTAAAVVSPPPLSGTSRARLSGGDSETFAIANTSEAGVDSVSEAPVHTCDPLERKVLRQQFNGEMDGALGHERGESSEDGSGNAMFSSGRKAKAFVPSLRASTAAEGRCPATAFSSEPLRGGRHLASWKGLWMEEETTNKSSSPHTAGVIGTMSPQISTWVLLQPERKSCSPDKVDRGGGVGEQGETGISSATLSRAPSQEVKITAEGTIPVAARLPEIKSIALLPFDDELHTVSQLRQWARSIARLEQLQPSTDTEVTT